MPARRRAPLLQDRVRLLRWLAIATAFAVVVRLGDLQIVRHASFEAMALGQHGVRAELQPSRGEIFARDRFTQNQLFPLATNRRYHLLYAVPKDVTDPGAAAKALDPLLPDLDEETVLQRLAKPGDVYEPLAHGLTDEEKAVVEALQLPGIAFADEQLRYYPEGSIGAHTLGFVGFDGDVRKGRYGLEGAYDAVLAGKPGKLAGVRDAAGRAIATADRVLERPVDGASLILTIDRSIQYEACTKLDAWVQQHGATQGTLVILNPKTGAVLALCGSPTFDPNRYGETDDIAVFTNPATSAAYEPGSVFKPITMSMALDLNKVTPQTTYEDTGEVKIGGFTIKNSDAEAHGIQTMTQVLEQSLNTGAIFAAQQVGDKPFEDYVKAFGFGAPTEIGLAEQRGDISSLKQHKPVYTATASYGQGITVTPLQLAAAYGALANGGQLMQPYVVEEVVHADGQRESTTPQVVRQVVSQRTAATVGAMMVNVVRNGHGQRAGVSGYFVAGKTGTAQIPAKDRRGYEENATIGTFAGFAPVDDPKFVMVVRVDRPKDVQFAESSAAPLFGQVAEFLLHYLGVPPQETVEEE